jgi:hypothetical protein
MSDSVPLVRSLTLCAPGLLPVCDPTASILGDDRTVT